RDCHLRADARSAAWEIPKLHAGRHRRVAQRRFRRADARCRARRCPLCRKSDFAVARAFVQWTLDRGRAGCMQRRGATNSPILVKEHAMSRWFFALLLAFAAQAAVAAVDLNSATKE